MANINLHVMPRVVGVADSPNSEIDTSASVARPTGGKATILRLRVGTDEIDIYLHGETAFSTVERQIREAFRDFHMAQYDQAWDVPVFAEPATYVGTFDE